MPNPQLSVSPVTLPKQIPEILPVPRFQLGQTVQWSHVPTGDFGRIVGVVYGAEASIRAEGLHYAIALDPFSPSYRDGILSDWGFEDDLELFTPNQKLSDRLEASA